MSQSGSCSLPQSCSGCAGLAGVNISLKNTTAYFSQVRLRRQLVEKLLVLVFVCTLPFIVGKETSG